MKKRKHRQGIFPAKSDKIPGTTEITITLDLPHRDLWPNASKPWGAASRGRGFVVARRKKKYRRAAYATMLEQGFGHLRWSRVSCTIAFYWPDRRRRDADNAQAAMKSAYDGIIDAGLVADDDTEHLLHRPPVFAIDREHPRVEITLRRMEEKV